jgi:nucleoside-diphosphate-sugar epimerase
MQKMKKERLLIIGGSSYIGSNLARCLSSAFEITLTYCNNPINIQNCHAVKIDLSDRTSFLELNQCEIYDHVIWCAQSENYYQSLDCYDDIMDVNVLGFQRFLEFSRLNGAKNLVYLSSGTVCQTNGRSNSLDENSLVNFGSYYAFSKYVAEQMCQHYALSTPMSVTILRLFTVYGAYQKNKVIPRLWESIRASQEIYLNQDIGMVFNAIYIEDLLKIICFFLQGKRDCKFEIYNVANPEILNLLDVCKNIGRLTGKKVNIQSVDKPILYSLANTKKLENKITSIKFTKIEEGLSNTFHREFK